MDTSERLRRNNKYYEQHINAVGERSDKRDFSKALKLFTGKLNSTGTVLDIG